MVDPGDSGGLAIKTSILNGFGQMGLFDALAAGQVGDGAGDFEDAGVAAGRETEAVGDHLEQLVSGLVHDAELADVAGLHLAVGVQAVGFQSRALQLSSGLDPGADGGGGFAVDRVGEILVRHAGHLDMQVDAVEQRTGEAGAVALQHRRGAGAFAQAVAEETAVAGIHCRHQHEIGGIGKAGGGATDADLAVFERLAQHFQHIFFELGELIQKKDAVVSEADFAGAGIGAADKRKS